MFQYIEALRITLFTKVGDAGAYLNRLLSNEKNWTGTVALLLSLQTSLILTHRPWLDEWQAALIASQASDLLVLLEQLRFEGHPPLWYLLLRLFAWVGGGPEHALTLANVFYASAGAYIVLRFSPFTRLDQILILTSEIVLVEYFSISRSLGLGVVIFLWALASWRSRWFWVPLALLPMCDFLFGILSILLLILRWPRRVDPQTPMSLLGMALWITCSLVAAYTVRPHPNIVSDPPYETLIAVGRYIQQLGMNILPWQMLEGEPAWNGATPFGLGLTLAPVFLYICYIATRIDRIQALTMFGFVAFLGLFVVFIYPLYFRHTSLTALLLIGLIWLRMERPNSPLPAAVRLWLGLLSIVGLATAAMMLSRPFDGARDAAAIIREEGLMDRPWFAYPAYRGIALSGEAKIPIGDLEQSCSSTFRRWSFRSNINEMAELLDLLHRRVKVGGSFYLMTSFDLPPQDGVFRRIGVAPYGYNHLKYYLWMVGEGAPVHEPLPYCVKGLRLPY
jgi:MFS family permease